MEKYLNIHIVREQGVQEIPRERQGRGRRFLYTVVRRPGAASKGLEEGGKKGHAKGPLSPLRAERKGGPVHILVEVTEVSREVKACEGGRGRNKP